jgi:phage baseplate assembly protein W
MSASRDAAVAELTAELAALAAAPLPANRPPADPYGRTLELADGDLVLERDLDGLSDFTIVIGKPELVQGLGVLVGTPLGTDILNRLLGLDVASALAAPVALRDVRELVRLQIVKALAQEPRVRQLQAIAFVDEPAFAQIYPGVSDEARAAQAQQERVTRRWTLAVLLDTTTGESANLDVVGTGA